MKKNIILLVILFLVGCMPSFRGTHLFSVDSINLLSDGVCEYYLSTGYDYQGFDDNFKIIDSIGKYQVGDTINLVMLKHK